MKSVLAVTMGVLVVATAAYAQEREPQRDGVYPDAVDSQWSPWIGCWQPVEANASDTRVCASRAGEHAVTFATIVGGQTVLEETLVADGMEHQVTDAECRGTRRAEWSRDGRTLFAKADLTCADQKSRRISGLALIATDGTWLDVQSSWVDARESLRVRRYRRIADSVAPLFVSGGRSFTLDAVREASNKVSPQALEAALAETNAQFDLNSRNVMSLADAGVPARIIDVMIALSYPQRFVVEKSAGSALAPFLPPAFLAADPFDYRAYYYSPFAYMYSGYYYPYAFGSSYAVFEGGRSESPRPNGAGQAIDGVGYTRVRQRESEPRATTSSSGAATSSTTGSTSSGGGSVSSSGYSSGGSASSSGSSGGGSGGGDSGRTAVPR
ncbi:MAG: hypothetical protein ABW292_02960 [Vicinamibacterales bacterium]